MKSIALRPADPERDFGQLAALFSLEQGEPTMQPALMLDYEQHKARIFRLMVAENQQGELLGFNWATRNGSDQSRATIFIIVNPEHRSQGVGSLLAQDLEHTAKAAQVTRLKVSVRDDCLKCVAFAERAGFTERSHSIGMTLDLNTFDERAYNETMNRLQEDGFLFTSMEALGNTEQAQRKLYMLNDMTDLDTPGSTGEHNWLSFDDFQEKVCRADWYRPAGQMIVIDTATGEWVGLSAITRFEGTDYAYNLHTGVDRRYRGRKLAQTVKVQALGYARQILGVNTVKTNHNSKNFPMIAIDRKFGYVQTPGNYTMEKMIR